MGSEQQAADRPRWRLGPDGTRVGAQAAEDGSDTSLAPEGEPILRRRQLLRRGFWAGAGVMADGGLAILAEFFTPSVHQHFGTVVTVPPDKVPEPGVAPYYDRTGKFWLANLKPGEGVPTQFVALTPPSRRGGLLALYQGCTHLGCFVPWRADLDFAGTIGWFVCPCHDARFTRGGVHLFGPAPRSMDTFPITEISNRGVPVNTGHVLRGDLDDPQRAVPTA